MDTLTLIAQKLRSIEEQTDRSSVCHEANNLLQATARAGFNQDNRPALLRPRFPHFDRLLVPLDSRSTLLGKSMVSLPEGEQDDKSNGETQ